MILTGYYVLVYTPAGGPAEIVSRHRALRGAVRRMRKLQAAAGEGGRYTVHHEAARSVLPGPPADLSNFEPRKWRVGKK